VNKMAVDDFVKEEEERLEFIRLYQGGK